MTNFGSSTTFLAERINHPIRKNTAGAQLNNLCQSTKLNKFATDQNQMFIYDQEKHHIQIYIETICL